jgi:phosphoenolpyruvate carboxykinase (GTP)
VDTNAILKSRIAPEHLSRLMALANPKLHAFVADAIELCQPESVYVCTDDPKDCDYIRQLALKLGEEKPLATKGHTIHFDGCDDLGRDPNATKYLVTPTMKLGERLKSIDKATGIAEIRGYLKDAMKGRQMLVAFFCLGPTNSPYSIPTVQITDSPYVVHSETILYRSGYANFQKIGNSPNFFRFLHSEGELENCISKNTDKRRIYIDLEENMVYTSNTQYGGNTIGLKKLSLRLALQKASKEGWLAEHMFVMGVHGPKGRVTYFTGAFPSGCGKTSTAMIPGQTIVGDDIAYFKKFDGNIRAVNVEKGIFGIIENVNAKDDPVIHKALTDPGEVIFSNVLITPDLKPHWLGDGCEMPGKGINHTGDWIQGTKDKDGSDLTASHKNARYTISLTSLANRDPLYDDPDGVPVGAVVYGGRDSDTWVPVEQAFSWEEGIIAKGASLESETTATIIGKAGVRRFDIMSNIDFVSIPLGKYIQNNIDFVKGAKKTPLIFSVNYFIKDAATGKYLTGMHDKKVWLLWAELRVHDEVKAVKTPTGWIPMYEDLVRLFKDKLAMEYSREAYAKQFTLRIPELLAKIDRIEQIYKTQVPDTPQLVYDVFAQQRKRLGEMQAAHGSYVSPFDMAR